MKPIGESHPAGPKSAAGPIGAADLAQLPAPIIASRILPRRFFERPAVEVAPALVGQVMLRRSGNVLRRARIVEVEAYLGPNDLASHASKGRTARTDVMFGEAGRAYVYFIYGVHWMFNIVVGTTGEAHAVLLRAAEPLDDWDADLTGPGKLARAFEITGADNRKNVCDGEFSFAQDVNYRPRIVKTKRIGVDYAKHWKDRLLRFVDVRNPVANKLRLLEKFRRGNDVNRNGRRRLARRRSIP